MRAQTASRRLPAEIARRSDGLLDFIVLAFAAWTAIYHVFLVLDIGAAAAAVVEAVALLPCGWLAFRTTDGASEPPPTVGARQWPSRRLVPVLGLYGLGASGVAALFAFTGLGWWPLWSLFFVVAVIGLALATARGTGRIVLGSIEERPSPPNVAWPELAVVLAWAIGLATFSLFVVRAAADDAYYARLSSWIAAHGRFPLRDVLFSDEVFPAIIFPPVSSFEALVGTVGHLTGVAAPNLLYLGVTPFASALSVLALWRLLRTWAIPMVAVALSVSLLFLLMSAQKDRTWGSLFIGRLWEGKIVFLAVLVPLLFALLSQYVERPTTRGLVLLFAGGAAGVGLTSTGSFLVPVVGIGCLAPFALSAPRRAALGVAAVSAYPFGALLLRAAVGGRRPAQDVAQSIVAGDLAHVVPGQGWPALVAVTAMLVGPVLIRRARAAQLTAGAVVLVISLYAPPVPRFIWDVTGIGLVLWRLNWAVPTAVLVGVLATSVALRARPAVLRIVPALALGVVLVVGGSPLWSDGVEVADKPSWKFYSGTVAPARRILANARAGDLILAPRHVSQTILIMSGEVTTVAPRLFYAASLSRTPGAHAEDRLLLQSFAEFGVDAPLLRGPGRTADPENVVRALHALGVDIACIRDNEGAAEVLRAAGYAPISAGARLTCMRASSSAASPGG